MESYHQQRASLAGLNRRGGFTLIEMITVITIITLLIAASAGALAKSKKIARRTKAEAELREMVNAFRQYCVTYPDSSIWPKDVDDKEVDTQLLSYISDPESSHNPRGIVFLNVSLPTGSKYNDPWGSPYRISFNTRARTREIALETAVPLPFRDMHEDVE